LDVGCDVAHRACHAPFFGPGFELTPYRLSRESHCCGLTGTGQLKVAA
jgi:hypothetical protein